MYINHDLCLYKISKDESKCGRIFRPWDNQIIAKDTSQDSTVSTTTQDEELGLKIEEGNEDKSVVVLTKSSSVDKLNIQSDSKYYTKGSAPSFLQHDSTSSISSPKSDRSCNVSKCSHHQNPGSSKRPKSHTISEQFLQTPSLYTKPYPELLMQTTPLPVDILQDPYNSVNTDLVQTNLAHHLGLPPNDPLLLESLAQGYALEEYARVLSQEQQAKLMASKKHRPKKYKCPHCDVGFSNNGQLKGHIRIHTGERPFKCEEKDCGKTFTRNEELTRHKRIHSGLRPFPCSHCGKRFGRKDHLKKHSRTHFQPRGLYAVPVVLPFEAWASGQTSGYPFFPVMY